MSKHAHEEIPTHMARTGESAVGESGIDWTSRESRLEYYRRYHMLNRERAIKRARVVYANSDKNTKKQKQNKYNAEHKEELLDAKLRNQVYAMFGEAGLEGDWRKKGMSILKKKQKEFRERPEIKARHRQYFRNHSANLSDSYIRVLLQKGRRGKPTLERGTIPQEMIELKRAQLRIIRLIKSIEKGEHHVESKTCI